MTNDSLPLNNQKHCTVCYELKPLSEFHRKSNAVDNYMGSCKECRKIQNEQYYKTKEGLTSRMYGSQRRNSRDRGHTPPNYSLLEFRIFIFKNKKFYSLFKKWVESGYETELSPSCDRIDDDKGYSFDNIQLMTWKENKENADFARKNGLTNKGMKAVIQLTMDGDFIKEYHSQSDARRKLGLPQSGHISECCRGLRRQEGGFRWILK